MFKVIERNITSDCVVGEYQFNTFTEALEYAVTMNSLMKHTPLNYKVKD